MARTQLTVTQLAPRGNRAGTVVTQNVPDVVNNNYWKPTGADIIIVRNPTAASRTIKVYQTVDQWGAQQGVSSWTLTIPGATVIWMSGIFRPMGFLQSDGTIWLDASAADIRVGILALNRP